jgi:uncharacterized protein
VVNALISLSARTNKILNIVKAMNDLSDKGQAIEFIVDRYLERENPALFGMVLTKENIISILEKNTKKLKELGVVKLGLFGSYIHGDNTGESDIDLLVTFKKNTLEKYVDAKEFIKNLFGKEIDLVFESTLKPGLEKVKDEAIYVKGL